MTKLLYTILLHIAYNTEWDSGEIENSYDLGNGLMAFSGCAYFVSSNMD